MMLNNDNFIIVAMKHYDNPSCIGIDEYMEDIKKFQYIQKLLKRKHNNKSFNVKLTLNHIITIYNLFGLHATEFLFFKIKQEYWCYLKPFLEYLNYMPERFDVCGETHINSDIPMDFDIIQELRKV